MNDVKILREALERMAAAEGARAAADLEREVLYGNAGADIRRAAGKLTAIRSLGPLGALRLLAAIGRRPELGGYGRAVDPLPKTVRGSSGLRLRL